ncbi:MAG TPA: MFS transporter [Ramlibacter sp.]|nr:MFS transporter [Ramlibacter sp.]
MSPCPSATVPVRAPGRSLTALLPRRFHLPVTASITLSFLAGSSAPTPLYPVYQAMWRFSSTTLTLVFASYVVVLLGALLVFGRLSDHVGRKPVILLATLMQVGAMALFATAGGVFALFAGRILQGFATGAAIGAIGAAMLDIDRDRGTVANAVAPALGTAVGGFGSGLLVHFLSAPALLVYEVLTALYLLQALAILWLPEPGRARPGAWSSLRPQLAVPASVRPALRAAVPVLVAGWAMAGFYASLGPALVKGVFGFDASLGGGTALFLLAGSAGIAVFVLQALAPERLVRLGARALSIGSLIVLYALVQRSLLLFVLGTIVAGVGFGTGFQGGVRTVLANATPSQSAGVLSVLFVVSYLAMGLPAVIAGWTTVRTGNLAVVAYGFAAAVFALALLAWRVGSRSPIRRPRWFL